MPLILFNINWMIYNLLLAVYPLIFSLLFFSFRNTILKVICAILWVLFVPNTIYIFLDLSHLVDSWGKVMGIERLLLILQYAIFASWGLLFFILAFVPFERLLLQTKRLTEQQVHTVIIVFNMLLGFAMVLGRVERINSWDVFFDPLHVVTATVTILSSGKLIGLTILLGIFANCFYFLFRKPFLKTGRKR